MDIRMPGMDGITTCEKIRGMSEAEKASVPVIALTAGTSKEEQERCLHAGMNDFLAKPFSEKDLYQRIVCLVAGGEHISPSTATDEKEHTKEQRYSLEGVKQLARGDESFLNELVKIFIESTREGFEQMNKACEEKNWNRIADYAHKIVAPCIHFEAAHLASLLRAIENNIRVHQDHSEVPALLKEAFEESEAIIAELQK
jgi:CheY-like chemotaxis protein